ncbi:GGDEF domain-containing protein [Pleomorphomonas oryzae]|uniref:GGDEF domain-containing protein n=1 Tax=Pleomorphomonas oryzae TaxID=261934 RepID=UPI00047B746B|nr:GGDEF domain-containing protein [Pleomorphomonas oryzae]
MSTFLDVPSLVIAASIAGACVSASHLLIWNAIRNEISVLIWSIAYGLMTISMIMLGLRGYIPGGLSIIASNAMLLLASGLIWLGYRRFIGKSATCDRFFVPLGATIWLAFACDGRLFADINFRTYLVSTIQFFYLLVLIVQLVRECRKEPLPALNLTVVVIAFQQAMLATRVISLFFFPFDPTAATLPNGVLISLTLIGSTAVVIVSGLLQMALVAQRSERRFRIAAETDELTGLANRRYFLSEILPRLADRPSQGALALFDLDHFKHINDTHGHLAGDRTLSEFARILTEVAPQDAITARVGGEEFAVFLPDATTDTAASLAERIRLLTHSCRLDTIKGELRVTVSGGVASVADVGSDYETLHNAADFALYKAKSEGRNRVIIHRPDPFTAQLGFSRLDDHAGWPASAAV